MSPFFHRKELVTLHYMQDQIMLWPAHVPLKDRIEFLIMTTASIAPDIVKFPGHVQYIHLSFNAFAPLPPVVW